MGSGLEQNYLFVNIQIFCVIAWGEIYYIKKYALVLVLLSLANMTNTNTILTVGIVFQYNTSRIVHLCHPYILL
jgi:hypothetical protein